MSEKQPWYVGERATALASFLLTSRKDVAIRQLTKDDTRIDILAEVLKDGAKAGRFFGVRVAGRSELPRGNGADRNPGPRRREHLAEPTLPLCAFVFDVRSGRGLYRWVVEPTVEGGEPRLNRYDASAWAELNEEAINLIVDLIIRWYDALAVHLRP
jgi:hypothetical protein